MMIVVAVLCTLGLGVVATGYVVILVAAFKKSPWWGILCLFVPMLSLLFAMIHWEDAKVGARILAAGIGIMAITGVWAGSRVRTVVMTPVIGSSSSVPVSDPNYP